MSYTRNIAIEFKNRHVSASLVHQVHSQAINTRVKGDLGAIVVVARSFTKDAKLAAVEIQKKHKSEKRDVKIILIEAKSDAEYNRLEKQLHLDPVGALQGYW